LIGVVRKEIVENGISVPEIDKLVEFVVLPNFLVGFF